MDIGKIKRPEDWPFRLTEDSSQTISEYLDALEARAPEYLLALLQDEIHAALRSQTEEEELELRLYYLMGGCREDLN